MSRDAPAASALSTPQRSAWVLVTVDSARIASLAAGTDAWDDHESRDDSFATLASVGSALLGNTPVGPILNVLQALIPTSDVDTADVSTATYPDPQVHVTLHERGGVPRELLSTALHNTIRPSWHYAFYVRSDTLRDRGLDIEVLDSDPQGGGARIGGMNIARDVLENAAMASAPVTLQPGDGELEMLRVVIEPVTVGEASEPQRLELDLSHGLLATGRSVPLGALVTIAASGDGTIGSGSSWGCPVAEVTTEGVPDGDCHEYNIKLPDLADAPHASAVALFGTMPNTRAVSLAQGREPDLINCVRFIAPASGPLVLGINDKDFDNNRGIFSFGVRVQPPPEDPSQVPDGEMAPGCE